MTAQPRLYDLPGCGEWEDAHDGYQRTVGAAALADARALAQERGYLVEEVR